MKPNFNNLIQAQLTGTNGKEVIMSHVTLPPNFTLPKHFHPGEEFAYVINGSFTLYDDEGNKKKYEKGGYDVVPYKKVHYISSGDEGAELLVFRVHEQGEAERVLV